jgi:alkanesulfonate monooxygenase SsuD/methylene tetrahydromethanopterin reductase-like flavin-dependent oxidoreductase (luciferase family)
MTARRALRRPVEYGVISLADHLLDPVSGHKVSQRERLHQITHQAILAEQGGFDVFGIGEHHFGRYISPAPQLALATVANQTSHIVLGTSVSLLANVDPVRYAEELSLLDVLTGGRAEATFARGVSDDTARAFGINSQEELRARFEESLRLVIRLLSEDEVSWKGRYRTPLEKVRIEPRPLQRAHDMLWIGGGLSEISAALSASVGLPLMLPSLFRWPSDYLPIVEHYRMQCELQAVTSRVGFPAYLHVARTSQEARRRWRPHLEHYQTFAMDVRGSFGRPTDFDSLLGGPAICGSPAECVERIAEINAALGLDRHVFLMDIGGLPWNQLTDAIELLATEVMPELW